MKLSDKLAQMGDDTATVSRPTSDKPAAKVLQDPDQREIERWNAAKRKVRGFVVEELSPRLTGPDGLAGEALENEVKALVDRILEREDVSVSPGERRRFVRDVLSDLLGYGPLDPLLSDPDITEVMCNDFNDVWVEKAGRLHRTSVRFVDPDQYRQVIDKIVSAVGRRVDESSPMVDARLPDGSRVNAIVAPLAVRGPALTIRRFAAEAFDVADLIGFGTLTADAALVLEAAVRGKLNVLVSGGTATGKTTLLNVLSRFAHDDERIITIEDAAELRLQQPHVVSLEARPPNAEGAGEVRIRDLVRNALRMRPDRIVVGEVRGAEALDMLQAMNTGHDGSLTTIHANSPRDALRRLETLVMMAGLELPSRAIREQIASALDLVVQIERLLDGQRRVTSIQEIQGIEEETLIMQEVFRHEPEIDSRGRDVGALAATGLRPRFADRLRGAGVDVPAIVFRTEPTTPAARRTNKKKK